MDLMCPYAALAKPVITFCEPNLCSSVVQPANAWSNIAFVAVGLVLLFISRREPSRLLRLFGPLAMLMGLASFLYHASYTFIGQMLDLLSMFVFISFLLVIELRRTGWRSCSDRNLTVLFIGLNVVSTAIMYYIRVIDGFNIGILIFALQVALVLILEMYVLIRTRFTASVWHLLMALALAAAGSVVWVYDYKRVWCSAASYHLLNGHSVWHILTASSLIFLYYHFRQFFRQASAVT